MTDAKHDSDELVSAVRSIQPARAADLADWIGASKAAVTSRLEELEKQGKVRRHGESWSVVVTRGRAPAVASASPDLARAFHADHSEAAPAEAAPTRVPVRRIVERPRVEKPKPVVAPAPEAARPDGRKNKTSPKLALVEANKHLLGTMPDTAVAAKIGVSIGTLRNYRLSKGETGKTPKAPAAAEPRPPKASPKRALVEANRALVGTMPDTELARQLGVSMETVRNYRIAEGIPVSRRRDAPKPEVPRPSGTKLGLVAANHDRLGTVSDAQLARELGVSPATVVRYRAMIGVPAPKAEVAKGRPASRPPRLSPKMQLVEQNQHLLGTMTDAALAKQLGVSHGTIYNFRAARGLTAPAKPAGTAKTRTAASAEPARHSPRTTSVAAKAPSPPAPTPEKPRAVRRTAGFVETQIWTVCYDDDPQEHIVVADSIIDAVDVAAAAHRRTVTRVARRGSAVRAAPVA